MADRGVLIRGFFMIGFPTETLDEIEATIRYAVDSNLTQAYFFNVVPQPGTPLYDLAIQENAAALQSQSLQEYNANTTWYAAAYGVDMRKVIKRAYFRFFVLSPRRWPRLVKMMPWRSFVTGLRAAIMLFTWRKRIESQPLPEALIPLAELYAPDERFVTSAETRKRLPVIQTVN